MAISLLFMAVTIFAFRGFFLGFVGVIGKVLGLICGYVVALSYRANLATWVGENTAFDLPPLVIEVGCGAALFFTTLFGVGFLVSLFATILKKIIPPLRSVLENDSTAGRITGSVTNGLLGAAIILIGIWGYGLLGKGPVEPSQLQQMADLFGNTLLNTVKEGNTFSLPKISLLKSEETLSTSIPTKIQTSSHGSAVIISESEPDKFLSIDTIHQEPVETPNTKPDNNLIQLLGNEKIQELLKNPQIQQFAMQQLENNPEKYKELSSQTGVNAEQLQELLKTLQQR